ncbi:unnamed protein product [Albugo candida]|uniref:Uncharacterized protein n=2 Tax=Albugo candida TaxID=65357 RepID=A0A024GGG3_9STRA|nr:unnamed protein product [Albugo candida]|eukprot:CCI45854.1 unnamed protein product [Albugo candida]
MVMQPSIDKYASFIQETLKPQLESCLHARDKALEEKEEYVQLLELVQDLRQRMHNENLKSSQRNTLVDLGAQFYIRAQMEQFSTIFVDIGLQFHVEMTLEEAEVFVQSHLKHLQLKCQQQQQKTETVSKHLRSAVQAIEQLMLLPHS